MSWGQGISKKFVTITKCVPVSRGPVACPEAESCEGDAAE